MPDVGSPPGEHSVVATYTGIDPPPPPPQVSAPRRSFSIDAKSTEMPTYGAALLSIFIIGLVGTLVGIFVYRRIRGGEGVQVGAVRPRIGPAQGTGRGGDVGEPARQRRRRGRGRGRATLRGRKSLRRRRGRRALERRSGAEAKYDIRMLLPATNAASHFGLRDRHARLAARAS